MASRRVKLVQLPIPQLAKFSPSGNVPLAAGCLAVAARESGLRDVEIETIDPGATESLGDTLLAATLARDEPAAVGFSLYLWNTERSLHVAREVKRLSPRTKIVIGGPEVGPDNGFVLAQDGFDVAVTGEAEEVFPRVLERVTSDRCPGGLPGVAVRGREGLSPFKPAEPARFELTRFPSPYVTGDLGLDPRRAAYVETVRGCRSHCTFCFYPRSSAVLRALDVAGSRDLIAALAKRGAREVVFLDPTFNHRPDFEALLRAIADVNHDRRLRFFAEVRAEGLTEAHADLLAAAGFTKLEIGLQSVNPVALAKTRRGGGKDQVARAAKMLEARGIDLLVDLIVGLPGDAHEHVVAGIDFLAEHGLGRFAQVFPLQVLPGTALRGSAIDDGIEFDPRPPYRVHRTATLESAEIESLLAFAEERLDRRLDEAPRPFLCDVDPAVDPADAGVLDVDAPANDHALTRPGAAHFALWITGRDLWVARDAIAGAVRARLAVDPFAVLDVVLAPTRTFPTNLVELLRTELAAEPTGYASRGGIFPGEDGARRISVVLPRGSGFSRDWIATIREGSEAREGVRVFAEMSLDEAIAAGSGLDDDLPAARIVGDVGDATDPFLRGLLALWNPESVAFADRAIERRFVELARDDRSA